MSDTILPPKLSNINSQTLGVTSKKNSLFVDIVQIGGGEVNSISKKNYKFIFWQKEEREGVIKELLNDFCPTIFVYKVM